MLFGKTSDCFLDGFRWFLVFQFHVILCEKRLQKVESSFLSQFFLRGLVMILLSNFILFGETSEDMRRVAKRSYFRVLAGFRSPLSGVTNVTGRCGWWPPILCLHGGRSNFNHRMRPFMVQLIHIMDATCTSSWMAHAIKCSLVGRSMCSTLQKASADLGAKNKEWLITISTLCMEFKPIKALSHAFRLLPISNWSLRLLTFLLAPDDDSMLSCLLAWMEIAEEPFDTLLMQRNFNAILIWIWLPPSCAQRRRYLTKVLSMWVCDFDEHMTLVPHWKEEAVLKQYLGWNQHLSTAWMAHFYVTETEEPRIEEVDWRITVRVSLSRLSSSAKTQPCISWFRWIGIADGFEQSAAVVAFLMSFVNVGQQVCKLIAPCQTEKMGFACLQWRELDVGQVSSKGEWLAISLTPWASDVKHRMRCF